MKTLASFIEKTQDETTKVINVNPFENKFTTITDTKVEYFESVNLSVSSLKFSNAILSDLVFINCTFVSNKFENVEFIGCKFINCKFMFNEMKDVNFKGSTFENSHYLANEMQNISLHTTLLDRKTLELAVEKNFELFLSHI